ncbi:tripartite tricarboxylate transporter TctB family protein [Nocardiopsis ansamitocini]|uniref:DUF1468 domain-containing protein n=1 Tax=Nocardiopsis ansamitocini TaxID=1670832 RepID=A0A9W6UFZ7_9ACTN|nr:tripartite tricarboxylate transporter TctB family protein [Nocardiopsis ansamitocini]GLU46231.1 hypothetical protein Nans01_05820 [Nocardiopsis ansamitocini]
MSTREPLNTWLVGDDAPEREPDSQAQGTVATGTAPGQDASGAVADAPVEEAVLPAAAPDPETTPWTGPGAWVFPAVVLAFGLVALWGAATITAPDPTPPGPGFFPGVIGGLLVAVAVGMGVVNVRTARREKQALAEGRPGVSAKIPATEWSPVLIIALTLAAHIALLDFLGWILAGSMLFWGVAYAFGARHYLRDAIVALAMASAIQVGFSMGLGLTLPGGLVELIF